MRSRRSSLAIGILTTLVASTAHAEGVDIQAQLIEQGQYWQGRSDVQRAGEIWEKVLRLDPNQVDALYGVGLNGVKLNKPQLAQQYLARLQALPSHPWQAGQLEQDIAMARPEKKAELEEARRLMDAGERDKADLAYQKLLKGLTPSGNIGRDYYNNLAFNDAGWPEARKGLERLVRENPKDSIIPLFLAKQLARHEDSREAGIRALAKLTQRADIAGDADESWRLSLTWLGEPTAAQVPLLEEFLKAHPDDQVIRDLMNKGKQRSSTAAVTTWKQDPLLTRGLQALEKGDLATAESAFQARLKAKADDADALGGLGLVRQKQNRLPEAEQLLGRAIVKGGTRWKAALDSVHYWSLLQQARDLQHNGQTARAKDVANQAIHLSPNNVDARLVLADIQTSAGEFDAAQINYRQVLAAQRGNLQALRGLIGLLSQTGQADEALSMLDALPPGDRARMGDDGQLRALRSTQVATVAEQRGDIAAAQSALADAVRNDPDNVWIRFSLARLYLKTGDSNKARDVIDTLLKKQPNNVDALYSSALLSVEMQKWNDAQAAINRIPVGRRTPEMSDLADEIAMTIQIQLAASMARRGQRQEALVLLDRLQPVASRTPERTGTLASAYIDAGDAERAQAMMRTALTKTAQPSTELMLQYAGLLLRTGDDAQVNSILRSLQNQPMSVATRKRYDDLAFNYRVGQADKLREGGNLAAAYDMLSPALAQRPNDLAANSALARMYSANGDNQKAFELYKPLLKKNPEDPSILLASADAAVQARDLSYSENALDQFMRLQNYTPDTLTEAARIYRAMGKLDKATNVLRKAVDIEQAERKRAIAAATQPAATTAASINPFRNSATVVSSRTATPADDLLASNGNAGLPTDAYPGQVVVGGAEGTGRRSRQLASNNPFVPPLRAAAAAPVEDVPVSAAQRALNNVLQERSGYVSQGVLVRGNNSETGLGKMSDVETPLEVNMPLGDNRVALRVTPVRLNAGNVKSAAATRFGNGSDVEGAGSQRDSGVGMAVAYERPDEGLKADIGTTPMGFQYTNMVGGVSVDRPLPSNTNWHYGVSASRRAVIDSVTSFAGTTDTRDGESWGGVTANGGRGDIGYDNGKVGAYGYGSYHRLVGHNVEANNRGELGGGIYYYLQNAIDQKLTVGLSATALGFENNQNFFTYGHGGYFSPQSFYALGMPITWSQRGQRFTYQIKGSVGLQHFKEDGADYFPDDATLQAVNNQRYAGDSKTSIGYSLAAAGEYNLGSHFYMGANLGLDNAQNYKQFNGALYVRYMFEDMTGSAMELPVSPYRSPYSN